MKLLRIAIVLAAFGAAAHAHAGAAEDFAAGRDAYRKGDVRAAVTVLKRAADAGHAPSQALLGEILDRAEANEEAVRYFTLAADQNDPEGLYGLALMQASGEGTPRDLAAAGRSMAKAADLGHKSAINAMALAYMEGGLAIPESKRDTPEALAWIEKAAANGHLPSVERLIVAFREGRYGLAPDAKRLAALEAQAKTLRGAQPRLTKKKT